MTILWPTPCAANYSIVINGNNNAFNNFVSTGIANSKERHMWGQFRQR